jgi:hypothetical protein
MTQTNSAIIQVDNKIVLVRKPEYPEKTNYLPQVTHKILSHNVLSSTPCLSGIQTHNVSGDRH